MTALFCWSDSRRIMFVCAIGGHWAHGVDLWGVEVSQSAQRERIRALERLREASPCLL